MSGYLEQLCAAIGAEPVRVHMSYDASPVLFSARTAAGDPVLAVLTTASPDPEAWLVAVVSPDVHAAIVRGDMPLRTGFVLASSTVATATEQPDGTWAVELLRWVVADALLPHPDAHLGSAAA